ncbi:cilia- and flagella-associated protein 337-like isoform X2 [Salvelinus alpinus]|uniref:cilia- and flagella-associated protein 337-like isoform X2 n=1 Tax=Salvelinus alpinus TaxID=8036 RepID=UPI0039FC76A3
MEAGLLESRLSMEDYEKLQSLFLGDSEAGVSFSRAEFIEQAWSAVRRGSREEYGLLFDSVVVTQEQRSLLLDSADERGERRVDWERLTSFLLLGLSEKEENERAATVPRWQPPRTLTPPHRDPVQQVVYLRSSSRYLSVSKGGTLGVWAGEDFALLQTHRLHNDSVRPKDLWVTAMVVLHNVHKVQSNSANQSINQSVNEMTCLYPYHPILFSLSQIAVSFTSKELCFYDLLSKQQFSCQYKVQGLRYAPLSLDYWCHPTYPAQAVLTMGDTGGQVSAICFRSAQISLFERPSPGAETDSADIIKWKELVEGRHRCCYTLRHRAHGHAWVRRVRFLGSLEALLSCSTSPQSSMVIGWREKEGEPLRVTAFHTEKGTNDLDHHSGMNLIATAGIDNKVLLWNPYVISKPVGVLRGHMSSVTAVRFIVGKKQLISFSKDKVLRLWDVASQLCIQRVAGVFPKTQEECHTLLFLSEERSRLLLSFNSLLLLMEVKREEGRRVTSHENPVTCVLYNSLFRQVISSDSGSTVICWLVDTGQKVKQFHRCHGDAEISTMALDGTQTRLFTAGTDGVVKIWDFNGHCHHRLNAGRDQAVDISQVLVLKRTVLVMGWERMLTVFRLPSFSQFFVQPSEWKGGVQHNDDVLCATFLPPQTLVTGSYDGELTVWNNSTENALRKLRPDPERERSRPQTVCNVNGEEDSESSDGVSRLFFLPGRKGVATVGGADLVSCGGSGLVRFWNTVRSGLVAVFTAHKDIGSIIMTMSACGRYLITADMEGTLKTWGIQEYCLLPSDGVTNEAPELLGSLRPHMDCVTHLETCLHGDRLLLLSASADCSVALSYLPGDTVGVFGQEEHWRLDGPGSVQVGEGEPKEGTVSPQSPSGTDPEFDSQPHKMREERRAVVETEEAGDNTGLETEEAGDNTGLETEEAGDNTGLETEEAGDNTGLETEEAGDNAGLEREELGTIIPGDCPPPSSILGRSYKERRGLRVSDSRPGHRETPLNTDVGTFSGLRIGEVQSVGELSRPEFIIHPHRYFNHRANTSPIITPLPANTEVVKAAFDERSLFPKELLDEEDRPSHGARKQGNRENRINDRGRGRKDRQRKGGSSGTFK